MKISFLCLILLVSCAHAPKKMAPAEEEAISPIVSIAEQKTHKATHEELSHSMKQTAFTEYNKDLKKSELFFATYEPVKVDPEDPMYNFFPAVVVKRNEKDPVEFISWPELKRYSWVSAAELPEKGYYWGFLDYEVEGRVGEVMVLWSQDSGKTWSQLSSIKKDYFADEFYAFTMSADGKGSASIKRSGESQDETNGFDVSTTLDYGKTWSTPVFHQSDVNFVDGLDEDCVFGAELTRHIDKECAIPVTIKK